MKIVLIVPYYGKFPNYFQLFLDSCKRNSSFNWLLFTDDHTAYHYPENVSVIYNTFDACKKIVQSKFDFEVELSNPQKLCDYKCAYGYIFEEYLGNADFWGYCDVDIIWGKLDTFITGEMLRKYDKLFSLGHFTLYRNTPEINRVFMRPLNGKLRYKEVFTTIEGCAFDEWYPENVNEIFGYTDYRLLLKNMCADIESYKTQFVLNTYNLTEKRYMPLDRRNMLFEYRDGHITQLVKQKSQLERKEYPYIHLQKRKMTIAAGIQPGSDYYIVPNCFIPLDSNLDWFFFRNRILALFNSQFFIVKYKSLKTRIKWFKEKNGREKV